MRKIIFLSIVIACLIFCSAKLYFYANDKTNFCHFADCGFEFVGKYENLNKSLKLNSEKLDGFRTNIQEDKEKVLGYYEFHKKTSDYYWDNKIDYSITIAVCRIDDSVVPSTIKGEHFLEGCKQKALHTSMETPITIYDNSDSLVLKYVSNIKKDDVEPVSKFNYDPISKSYIASSSVIYKNGFAYFITITSYLKKYTSAELYDIIMSHCRIVNVRQSQTYIYSFAVILLMLACILLYILHYIIKKYTISLNEDGVVITYNIVIAKIIWIFTIIGISTYIIVNISQSRLLLPYMYGYISMYVILFLYYLYVIVNIRHFGIKQVLFGDMLQWGKYIKNDWSEVKIRTVIMYFGVVCCVMFYALPYCAACYDKLFDNDTRDLLMFISLSFFYAILILLFARIWIYAPQKTNEYGKEKQ